MENLTVISNENTAMRQMEVALVERILDFELEKFMDWWLSRRVIPTVVMLRENAEKIRESELGKTMKKLRHLSSDDQEYVRKLSKSLINKLLHNPIAYIKDHNKEGDTRTLERLFGLDKKGDIN